MSEITTKIADRDRERAFDAAVEAGLDPVLRKEPDGRWRPLVSAPTSHDWIRTAWIDTPEDVAAVLVDLAGGGEAYVPPPRYTGERVSADPLRRWMLERPEGAWKIAELSGLNSGMLSKVKRGAQKTVRAGMFEAAVAAVESEGAVAA